jgi:hypothetical protein
VLRAAAIAVPRSAKEAFKALRNRYVFRGADYPEVFRIVHDRNLWDSAESLSGAGSTIGSTEGLRSGLGEWLARSDVRSLVDLPCGDFNWMRLVRFPAGMDYLGIDIVPALVAQNRSRYGADRLRFEVGDVLADALPAADVYFCRDLLIHFPNAATQKALANIRRSGARYLLATTFPGVVRNLDTRFPDSRPQNLALHIGEPDELLPDFGNGATGKFIGVWRLS